jgi:hypothetical protein
MFVEGAWKVFESPQKITLNTKCISNQIFLISRHLSLARVIVNGISPFAKEKHRAAWLEKD